MKILHYSLGLSPYRSGGLTKYSIDLMKEQAKENDVFLIFPGELKIIKKTPYIKKYKNKYGIEVYELKNPQAVSLLNGIGDVSEYTKTADKKIFREFLIEKDIQVIHLHTLMGLYIEILEVAKELKIKIILTTHDYFGLCPNPNFLDKNGEIKLDRTLKGFNQCNINPNSNFKIRILQSVFYRELKNRGGIELIKKYMTKNNIKKENKVNSLSFNQHEYEQLIDYYDSIFNLVDLFLFNSTVTCNVYKKFLNIENRTEIITITHSDIKDNRVLKDFTNEKIKVSYLGTYKEYKGFNDALKIAENFKNENIEFEFHGDIARKTDNLNVKIYGKYKYSDLKNIFSKTDLLIVPSKCYETFGFIVLEALSYGVPVMVTENVGAKDILLNKGIITDDINSEIKKIIDDRNILVELNKNIYNSEFTLDFKNHNKKILDIYNRGIR